MLKKFLPILFLITSLNLFGQSDSKKTITVDEDKIPYGFLESNYGLVYNYFNDYEYLYWVATSIPSEIKKTTAVGYGLGLDLHMPLIYLFAHQNEKRLRFSDDFGLGTYMNSNSVKFNFPISHQDFNAEGESSISGAIILYAGIQACYRLSNKIDIGVKYDPAFMHYDFESSSAVGPTYGLHARVQRCYLDWKMTNAGKSNNDHDARRFNNFTAKYILHPFDRNKINSYLFFSFASEYYNTYLFGRGNTPTGDFKDYAVTSTNWTLIQLGWGMMAF